MITRPGTLRLWLACAVICSCGLTAFRSNAATLSIWDGSSSGYWSLAANWVFNGRPNNGDTAVFSSGPARLTLTNDIVGLALDSMIFNASGYVLRSNLLTVSNSISASYPSGVCTVALPIRAPRQLLITNVNAGALLRFFEIDMGQQPLIFRGNGDITIDGAIDAPFESNPALIKQGLGTLSLTASNRLGGRNVSVEEGTLRLYNSYATAGGGLINVAEEATLQLLTEPDFPTPISLTGTLDDYGQTTLSSYLRLNGTNAVIRCGTTTATLLITNPVLGTRFTKTGTGILHLSAANTYTGPTVVEGGYLRVDGSQATIPIVLNQGSLFGTGTVGTVTCPSTGLTGILGGQGSPLTTASLTLNTSTWFYTYVETSDPGGFTQLRVNGTVNLGGAQLYAWGPWADPRVGDSLVVLDNDGVDPIVGQFSGLAEGSSFVGSDFNGGSRPIRFQITYTGGDGNDVALRVLPQGAIWDGLGTDVNWTNANNWASNFRPILGESLFFPAGAARTSNFCNYAVGTPFASIHFSGSGFHLAGNAITLEQGISAATNTGLNRISIPLSLATNQTFTASNNALLRLGAINTQGRDLTLDGAGDFELLGTFAGNGGLIKRGAGSAAFLGSDAYAGAIEVQGGELRLTSSGILGIFAVGTTVFGGATLSLDGGQTVFEPLTLVGTLKRNNSGSGTPRAWNGAISLQGAPIVDTDTLPLTIGGVISGPGSLIKNGSGLLTLTRSNTYSGATVVNAGQLVINGVQAQNLVQLNGGALGGTGVVGQVIASGAGTKRLEPGGILTTSNILFNSFTVFTVDLNGATPGTGHGQLNVRGTINLGNSRLDPIPGLGLAVGQVMRIINNDGADAITGRFANLPEGGTMTASNGLQLRITYQGGDGNDVVLTVENPPSRISTVSRTPEGYTSLTGQGLPNVLYTLEASTTLLPGSWEVVSVDLTDPSGVYEFIDVDAPTYARRFYRVSSP